MPYFIHVDGNRTYWGTWTIQNGMAWRLGVPNAQSSTNAYVVPAPQPGETDLDALKRQIVSVLPSASLIETKLSPGEFYPRMARPIEQHPYQSPGDYPGFDDMKDQIAVTQGQLVALTRSLEDICQTVHPAGNNLNVFGHDTRNLLILASTEAEAQWAGVLQANGVSPINGRTFTTRDYVKLADTMRLREYEVRYPYFPQLNSLCPFALWGTTGSPTQELPWYHAYNAVKHDREREFRQATLFNAFQAVAACAVMIYAQYGMRQLVPFFERRLHFVEFEKVANWSPADVYIHPYPEPYTGQPLGPWISKPYPF